jgi:hypothetical protein
MTALITKQKACRIVGFSAERLRYYQDFGAMTWLPRGRGGAGVWSLDDVTRFAGFVHFATEITTPRWMADNLEALLHGGMVNSQGFHLAFDPSVIRERIEPLYRAAIEARQ